MKFIAVGLALLAHAFSAAAADAPAAPTTGFKPGLLELSVYDMPAGSFDNLGKAIREYRRRQMRGEPPLPPGPRADAERYVAQELAARQTIVEVPDARLDTYPSRPGLTPEEIDTQLWLKPLSPAITVGCEVTSTRGHKLMSKGRDAGYLRHYRCADGDVMDSSMLMLTMGSTTFKELANVDLNGIRGYYHALRDAEGNGYSNLRWVSNNTLHNVQKSGTDEAVRAWLVSFALEVIAAGR